MIDAVAALVPVVVFLGLLVLLDSFKLLRPSSIAAGIAAGAFSAAVALAVQQIVEPHLPRAVLTRYVAPALEESLKLLFLVYAIGRRRVAFPVEAGILGFAVGAGFAVVENVYYLGSLSQQSLALWLVRGFGAAVLHGASTSIAAILTRDFADRRPDRRLFMWAPGLLAAIAIHSLYNHFVLPPAVATLVLLAVLPPLVLVVFERSERATREWVGAGLDLDVELLRLILSNDFGQTRLGAYLGALRARFPGPVVADMFCLLRVQLELSIRAKAFLLAREAGVDVPFDDELLAKLEESRYLERSIGATGRLALKPLQVTSERDDWHQFLLEARSARRPAGRKM